MRRDAGPMLRVSPGSPKLGRALQLRISGMRQGSLLRVPHLRTGVVALLLASGLLIAVAAPAQADEFGIVLLVDGTEEPSGAGTDARDGFRMAVDESPDVSHPPGEEAGDHLGGVDADIQTVEARTAGQVRTELRQALLVDPAYVVILAPSSPTIRSVEGLLRGNSVVLTAGSESSGLSLAGGVTVRELGSSDGSDAIQQLAIRFMARYGRPLSPWAVRGYDAALVIDRAVGALGPQSRDAEKTAEVANAPPGLIGGEAVAAPAESPSTSSETDSRVQDKASVRGRRILLPALAVATAALLVLRWRHRRSGIPTAAPGGARRVPPGPPKE